MDYVCSSCAGSSSNVSCGALGPAIFGDAEATVKPQLYGRSFIFENGNTSALDCKIYGAVHIVTRLGVATLLGIDMRVWEVRASLEEQLLYGHYAMEHLWLLGNHEPDSIAFKRWAAIAEYASLLQRH